MAILFIFLSLVLVVLYLTVTFLVSLLLLKISLKFLPPHIAKSYEDNKRRAKAIILACSSFFYLGGWAINHYLFPNKLHPISLLANAVILLFTISLGWSFLKKRGKTPFIYSCPMTRLRNLTPRHCA